jgi:hypothetical protein
VSQSRRGARGRTTYRLGDNPGDDGLMGVPGPRFTRGEQGVNNPGPSRPDPDPTHKAEFILRVNWSGAWAAFEIASCVDLARVTPPASPAAYADQPRTGFFVSSNGFVHIVGWLWLDHGGMDQADFQWSLVDMYIPAQQIVQMQVHQNEDWEGKDDQHSS